MDTTYEIKLCVDSLCEFEKEILIDTHNRLSQMVIESAQTGPFREGVQPYILMLDLLTQIIKASPAAAA